MATAKTGSFYLNETVTIPAASASGTRIMGTLDLSAYVNVPTGQAIAIDEVDFIWQVGTDFSGMASQIAAADIALNTQLTDLNPGTAFVRADDQSLVASQHIDVDQGNNSTTESQDLYPDNFGPSGLSDMFICVNDQLYLTAGNDGATTGSAVLYCTARVRCRVVKLSTKDWMAVAIQSTAADN
jgi:hypothetical protein